MKRDEINHYLYLLAKELHKRYKKQKIQLVIAGGSSIVLKYSFRETTMDVDAIQQRGLEFQDLIYKIAEENDIKRDWLNCTIMQSKSYSPLLIRHAKYYKTFCNTLEVYLVADLDLITMKFNAFRAGTHDLDDLNNLVKITGVTEEEVIANYKLLYEDCSDSMIERIHKVFKGDLEELQYPKELLAIGYKTVIAEIPDSLRSLLPEDDFEAALAYWERYKKLHKDNMDLF